MHFRVTAIADYLSGVGRLPTWVRPPLSPLRRCLGVAELCGPL
jgi:hypothetical protein